MTTSSLSELSRYSRSFVSISSDNRVHLWDTDTRKEKRSYVEKNHLQHSYNCFAWKQLPKNVLGLFAVGCSDGMVIVWDFARGVVIQSIQATDSTITGVSFSLDGSSVFVSSEDNHILSFSVKTGEQVKSIKAGKKGIARMVINPRIDALAVASSSIKLVDVASDRKRKLDAIFAGGVTAMAFSDCGCYLAASGGESREVLVFDVQASASTSGPIFTIPVAGITTQLSLVSVLDEASDNASIVIMAVFETSDAAVIRCSLGGEDSPAISYIRSGGPIHGACFGQIGEQNTDGISLSVGLLSHPSFILASYESSDGTMFKSVEVAGSSNSIVDVAGTTGSVSAVAADKAAPMLLGPLEAGPAKRLRVDESAAAVVTSSKKAKKESENGADLETVSEELTLEQRLEALSGTIATVETTRRLGKSASAASAAAEVLATPTSDSLVVLVDQALQSGDDGLLEECLGCEDLNVVNATVARLTAVRIVPLLKKLVAKFEKRPSRSSLLTLWLASILRAHSSFLMSCPDLSSQLAGLSQILEQRLSSYSKLAALGGRLDLLMQQVTSNAGAHGVSRGNAAMSGPARVLRDE